MSAAGHSDGALFPQVTILLLQWGETDRAAAVVAVVLSRWRCSLTSVRPVRVLPVGALPLLPQVTLLPLRGRTTNWPAALVTVVLSLLRLPLNSVYPVGVLVVEGPPVLRLRTMVLQRGGAADWAAVMVTVVLSLSRFPLTSVYPVGVLPVARPPVVRRRTMVLQHRGAADWVAASVTVARSSRPAPPMLVRPVGPVWSTTRRWPRPLRMTSRDLLAVNGTTSHPLTGWWRTFAVWYPSRSFARYGSTWTPVRAQTSRSFSTVALGLCSPLGSWTARWLCTWWLDTRSSDLT